MNIRFRRQFFQKPLEDGLDGGAAPADPVEPVEVAAPEAPAPEVVAEPAAGPKTMLEAIEQSLAPKEGDDRPRDPSGRFVPKSVVDPVPVLKAGQKPAVPGQQPAPIRGEDARAMPEGLTPKAQERFQHLANTNRDLEQKLGERDEQTSYIRQTFETHGVQQEQFELATGLIGMVNRGDYKAAMGVLQDQMQQLALLSGQQVGQIDALAKFPDLRQRVDSLQISEDDAIELARGRHATHVTTQHQQQVQQTQQAQQQETQVRNSALVAVDRFCKQMEQTDLDYKAIEAQLTPALPRLLSAVPPSQWAAVVQVQYETIKRAAGAFRTSGAQTLNPLRPSGPSSTQVAPKSMFEAMFPGGA